MDSVPSSVPSSKEIYNKRKIHWEKSESTIKTMVGVEEINLPDIKCSVELLAGLTGTKKLSQNRALDCGAGIGRVTENVLSKYFKEIDLYEQNPKFVEKINQLKEKISQIADVRCSSTQDYTFTKKYDLIWIQWCLENLEDEDLSPFLQKCYNNLEDKGLIIVKENYYNGENNEDRDNPNSDYAESDLSKQRKDVFYINLFMNNKFKIIHHFSNPNWPNTAMPVIVYVLSKA